MIRRWLYFGKQALGSVRDSPGISLVTVVTIAATLLVTGLYLMGLQNLERLAMVWGRVATITAYVDDALNPDAWPAVQQRIARQSAVAQARLVSPAESLARFRARGTEAAALVEGVSEDVLPASVEVRLHGGFVDLATVEQLAQRIGQLAGVADVDYGQQEIGRLRALLDMLRYGGLAAGLLILAATAFIISNTIRLTVYSRRDEISILQLVGATSWFIRTPFLLEGAFWGLGGAGVATGLLWLLDTILAVRLSEAVVDVLGGLELRLFDPQVAMFLLLCGVFLGMVGSFLAVGRFLDLEGS